MAIKELFSRIISCVLNKLEEISEKEEELLTKAPYAKNIITDIKISVIVIVHIIVLLFLNLLIIYIFKWMDFHYLNLNKVVLISTLLIYFILVVLRIKRKPLKGGKNE